MARATQCRLWRSSLPTTQCGRRGGSTGRHCNNRRLLEEGVERSTKVVRHASCRAVIRSQQCIRLKGTTYKPLFVAIKRTSKGDLSSPLHRHPGDRDKAVSGGESSDSAPSR
jgi:hypothetical protein